MGSIDSWDYVSLGFTCFHCDFITYNVETVVPKLIVYQFRRNVIRLRTRKKIAPVVVLILSRRPGKRIAGWAERVKSLVIILTALRKADNFFTTCWNEIMNVVKKNLSYNFKPRPSNGNSWVGEEVEGYTMMGRFDVMLLCILRYLIICN